MEIYTIEVKRFFPGSEEEYDPIPDTYRELVWVFNKEQTLYWLSHPFNLGGNNLDEVVKSLGENGSVIANMHEYFITKHIISVAGLYG
jgi:hypothetical protein